MQRVCGSAKETKPSQSETTTKNETQSQLCTYVCTYICEMATRCDVIAPKAKAFEKAFQFVDLGKRAARRPEDRAQAFGFLEGVSYVCVTRKSCSTAAHTNTNIGIGVKALRKYQSNDKVNTTTKQPTVAATTINTQKAARAVSKMYKTCLALSHLLPLHFQPPADSPSLHLRLPGCLSFLAGSGP